jgi:hypothetical protein
MTQIPNRPIPWDGELCCDCHEAEAKFEGRCPECEGRALARRVIEGMRQDIEKTLETTRPQKPNVLIGSIEDLRTRVERAEAIVERVCDEVPGLRCRADECRKLAAGREEPERTRLTEKASAYDHAAEVITQAVTSRP